MVNEVVFVTMLGYQAFFFNFYSVANKYCFD